MSGIGALSIVTVTQAAQNLLPLNKIRKNVIVQNNDSTHNMVVKPDSNPANDTDGIVLTPGQKEKFEMVNAIYSKSNNVAGTLSSILETTD